jgi:hypothetical protein
MGVRGGAWMPPIALLSLRPAVSAALRQGGPLVPYSPPPAAPRERA